ncbi:MAG TPA: tyrosine-type recombinase/integrase [Methylomirabilota bacterium]|nr:tyrosine-type recombinase/integrase [Methylomirabilota bacterium]
MLEAAGRGAEHFEGYTSHGNRHTFASRLVMAGVDLRTVQQLRGWQRTPWYPRRRLIVGAACNILIRLRGGVAEPG